MGSVPLPLLNVVRLARHSWLRTTVQRTFYIGFGDRFDDDRRRIPDSVSLAGSFPPDEQNLVTAQDHRRRQSLWRPHK